MNSVIKSIIINNNACISEVELFGHASKSLPGLELIGFGKQARIIKEKIIFLTRLLKIKIPLNRYVVCLESDLIGRSNENMDMSYLELPILILFWSMAGVIPLKRLDNLHSLGKITLEQVVIIPHPLILKGWPTNKIIRYLCPDVEDLPDNVFCLPITELMGAYEKLSFKWQEYELNLEKVSHIRA